MKQELKNIFQLSEPLVMSYHPKTCPQRVRAPERGCCIKSLMCGRGKSRARGGIGSERNDRVITRDTEPGIFSDIALSI